MSTRNLRLSRFILCSVIPVGILFFYILPSLLVLFIGYDPYSFKLLVISGFAIMSFILVWCYKIDVFLLYPLYKLKKHQVNFYIVTKYIIVSYFVLMLYVIATAPTLPLFDAIRGCGVDTLAIGRETFLRTRAGWEVVLNYTYVIYRSFLMPFAICYCYNSKNKYRHFVLIVFLFTLVITLEKSIAITVLLPLIFLFFQKKSKIAIRLILFMLVFIIATSFLAGGGVSKYSSHIPDRYMLFKGDNLLGYVMNRTMYIPYITSIDWIRYRQEVLNREPLYGMNVFLVSSIFGKSKINLEREVFAYQCGQNDTNTGSANTAYFIDSYMNFGFLGCFVYSIILAFTIRVIVMSKIYVMRACLFFSLVSLLFNSLSAMLFSGGLFLSILFAMFLKDEDEYCGYLSNEYQ